MANVGTNEPTTEREIKATISTRGMLDHEIEDVERARDRNAYMKRLYTELEKARRRNHRGDIRKFEAKIADQLDVEKKRRLASMARFSKEWPLRLAPATKTVATIRPSIVIGSDKFIDGTPSDVITKTTAHKATNIENSAHLIALLSDPAEVEDSIIATFNTHKHPTLWEELDILQIISIAIDRRLVKFLEDLHTFLTRSCELLNAKRGYYAYITSELFSSKKAELEEKIVYVADAIKEASEKLITDAEEAAAAAARTADLEARRTLAAEKSLADATNPKRAEYVTLLSTFADKMIKDSALKGKAQEIKRALASGTLPSSTLLTKKMAAEVRTMGLANIAGLEGGKRRTQKRRAKQSRKQTRRH